MDILRIIKDKRDGKVLTKEEIEYFVENYTLGKIPDYQAAALLMAIYFQKMNREETFLLTDAMMRSGDQNDLGKIDGIKVDKHSTGGVGDKTSLIVGPIVAAAGVPVAKMSGRGLGFTGGTIDKMESIPGLTTELSEEDFVKQVSEVGLVIVSQTKNVAPADKKLYALRDVTGTVRNMSLIASSIMSKKLASGSDAIVLDVKVGSGALMKTNAEAKQLANIMCDIGEQAGKKTVAVLTDMSQPLGLAVGNSLEIKESVEVLAGAGPEDLKELCISLAGIMIYIGEKAADFETGKLLAQEMISTGKAMDKFREFVSAQGGDLGKFDYEDDFSQEIRAKKNGYITRISADFIGIASRTAGAGRVELTDKIDHKAGIILAKKVGSRVLEGELLATVYSNDKENLEEAARIAETAFDIGQKNVAKPKIIREFVGL